MFGISTDSIHTSDIHVIYSILFANFIIAYYGKVKESEIEDRETFSNPILFLRTITQIIQF